MCIPLASVSTTVVLTIVTGQIGFMGASSFGFDAIDTNVHQTPTTTSIVPSTLTVSNDDWCDTATKVLTN